MRVTGILTKIAGTKCILRPVHKFKQSSCNFSVDFFFTRHRVHNRILQNVGIMMVPTKTMKSLVNSLDDTVKETLHGLRETYPQLEYNPTHRVVFAPGIRDRKDKVSLISGGGSGHEPFAAGYVGRGMLAASVAGLIFAAPPSIHITYAIENIAAHSNAGILMVIPNYTGDCLNFGIAIEKARQAKLKIAEIIVDEDCSIPKEEQGAAGKRGLTGLLFVIKIAGALAERGLPLEEVTQTARNVLNNMATYAVGLTACAIPGQGMMFELADDEIECGMGIHGEAGYERIKLKSAAEVVSFMLKRISNALSLTSGESVAVMVNNFGALSQLEQGIVAHEVVRQLKSMGVQPLRVYSGILLTSLNSAGVHVTVLKIPQNLRDTFIGCLDDITQAPKWPGCAYSIPLAEQQPIGAKDVKRTVDKIGIEFQKHEIKLMEECLKNVCDAISAKEAHLNDLDRGCGDGDCGTTLKRLADGILQNLNNFHLSHPSTMLLQLGNVAEDRMGGTSGALYCLFFTTMAKELASTKKNGWPAIWAQVFRSGVDCLMKYGKAKPGDRTMIDAMDAACVAYEKSLGASVDEISEKVAAAAWQGCEATKNMKPRAGRASYVKQTQYLQEVDAGAYAVATWISAVATTIVNFHKK